MLLDDLTPEERGLFEGAGVVRSFSSGDYVVKEGDQGDSLFVVVDGVLEVEKVVGPNRAKQLEQLGPGDFFGEMSFFHDMPRSASVLANSDCKVLELVAEDFSKLMGENATVSAKFYKSIAEELTRRLRTTNEEVKKAILWAIDGWTYLT